MKIQAKIPHNFLLRIYSSQEGSKGFVPPAMSLWRLILKRANILSKIVFPLENLPKNCHFLLPMVINRSDTIFLYPRLLCLLRAQFQMFRHSILSRLKNILFTACCSQYFIFQSVQIVLPL